MAIKKKSKKDAGRGRPKKEFKLKHKRSQTAQHPAEQIQTHEMPRVHTATKINFSKDRSILYLFVFSVILFVFSLGASFMKKHRTTVETPEAQIPEETGQVQIVEEIAKETPVQTSSPIITFYEAINNKDFTAVKNMADTTLKYSNTFLTYFNTRRLTRFVNNISTSTIQVSDITETVRTDNPNISDFTYTLTYTVTADSTPYTENRSATAVKKGDEYKIAAIRCTTTGCSRMPFFNPAKYGIK